MGLGGTKEGRKSPCSTSWQSHAASATFSLAAGDAAEVVGVEQPALQRVLEHVVNRLPQKARVPSGDARHRVERDAVAELLETMEIVAREAVRGQAIEVIGAEVAVGNPRAQDVIRRDEDAVARGEGGLLLAAAVREAGVLRAEIGPPAAAGTPAALDQQRLEPAVAL